MTRTQNINVRERQGPLMALYHQEPEAALITDQAQTYGGEDQDPFHGSVLIGQEDKDSRMDFGIHSAVGGFHDMANPGDMLCAALASCMDSTTRVLAGHFRIGFKHLAVKVKAELDVRGTLLVDGSVPVGFQRINCEIEYEAVEGTSRDSMTKVFQMAEHCCVVMQTLKGGVEIQTNIKEINQ